MGMRLNLGCGPQYKKGYVNLDYNPKYKVDVLHNLDKFPYPFKKDTFDEIYCSHILEHVEDFFKTMKELLRILKLGGIVHIRVPHFSNGTGYTDLSHKRTFGYYTFNHMIEGYYNEKFDFKIEMKRFNFLGENNPFVNKCFSWIFNSINYRFYERFLAWTFPVGEIELKLRKIQKN